MEKQKSILFGICGVVLAVAVGVDLDWRFKGYGYKSADLDAKILAQDIQKTDTNDNGDDEKKGFDMQQSSCSITITGAAVTIGGVTIGKIGADGFLSYSVEYAQTLCLYNGDYVTCTTKTCGEFWEGKGTPSFSH